MSDVNSFIDAIGKDINATVVPKVESLAGKIGKQALEDYVPKTTAFANQLVKEIIDEQSVVIRDFVSTLLQDVFRRYRPEVGGQLRTRIVQDGIQITGEGIRLDLKRRDTGAAVASLDIPVALTIKVNPVGVTLHDATISLDVVR